MSDFLTTYNLTRARFDGAVTPLNAEQLNFKLHADALSIGQMALHVAGVEVWFCAQLTGTELSGELALLAKAATDGSVNDLPFPYADAEITPEKVAWGLAEGRKVVEALLGNFTEEVRRKELKSALGPIIDGDGAAARLCAHPFYHQGQAYLIATAPGFPK